MARKRSITSAMGTDERIEQIAESDQLSAMMWPWLLTAFDDWGMLDITAIGKIRMEIFPAFPKIKNATIQKAIEAYASAGMVYRYCVDEKTYLAIRPKRWMKWQSYLNGKKRSSMEIPCPPPSDAPWPSSEFDEMLQWMIRSDERRQSTPNSDVDECRQMSDDNPRQTKMSDDIPRQTQMSVPSPSPSLYSTTTTARVREEDGGGLDDSLESALYPKDKKTLDIRAVLDAARECGWNLPTPKDLAEAEGCVEEYGVDWVVGAIYRAHERSARNWGYVKGILNRWRTNGGMDDAGELRLKKQGYSPHQPLENSPNLEI